MAWRMAGDGFVTVSLRRSTIVGMLVSPSDGGGAGRLLDPVNLALFCLLVWPVPESILLGRINHAGARDGAIDDTELGLVALVEMKEQRFERFWIATPQRRGRAIFFRGATDQLLHGGGRRKHAQGLNRLCLNTPIQVVAFEQRQHVLVRA